ncbi:hypothetical protein BJV77DRAFT_782642 [Russula vinacea]|nr:hypothetical protein BJV77DRAFT_782642 [Russula vinacea]
MGRLVPTLQLIAKAFRALTAGRYSIGAAYTILFYEWIISLDKEVAFIYPAPWNAVKIAYLFCRYFPLAVSPFLFWGFLGNHTESVCRLYYHALYACVMPSMLSAQFILMLRSYAFSGRRRLVLVALLTSFLSLVGYVVWVVSNQLDLTALFRINESSGCFATSNQPVPGLLRGVGAYQLGVISVLTAFFDCLNMFVVVRHCVRERSTLGPLGESFLKQGVIVYVIMTALNAFTIGTYFSSHLLFQAQGSWFAYILPSALSCRLQRQRIQNCKISFLKWSTKRSRWLSWNHVPGDVTESFIPPSQGDTQAEAAEPNVLGLACLVPLQGGRQVDLISLGDHAAWCFVWLHSLRVRTFQVYRKGA